MSKPKAKSKPEVTDHSRILETILGDKLHWLHRGMAKQTLEDAAGDPIYRYSLYRGNVVIDFYPSTPEAISLKDTIPFTADMAILLKNQLCINTVDNFRNTLLDVCLHKSKSRKLHLEGFVKQVYYSIQINPEIFATNSFEGK